VGFDREKRNDSVYAKKVKAGKRRTYFFDVRQTKGNDYFVTITESTRRFEDEGYNRHKIFLYKEDFNRFMESLNDVVDHVKNELMPDFDYDEYARRYDDDEYVAPETPEKQENIVSEESVNEISTDDIEDGEQW
jgi:hypothetical protein